MFKRIAFICSLLLLTGAGCIQIGGKTTGPAGTYVSIDKGETWTPKMSLWTTKGVASISGVKVYRIHEDPSDPNAWYLASRGQGLFYTYNNGDSWQQVPVFNGKFIYGVAVDPKNKCIIYASDGPQIYKSTDCNRTWQIVYHEERPDQRLVSIAVDYGDSNLVYGAILGGDIIVSKDAGKSWRVTKRFKYELQYLATDPKLSKRIYVAARRNGLARSDDAGENWQDLSADFDNFSDAGNFYRLYLNPAQKDSIFWVSKYGILRSDDAGATWKELKLITPPGSVNIYGFAINPNNQKEIYYTGTVLGEKNAHVRSTFYRSTDGGINWITKKLPTNTIPTYIVTHPKTAGWLMMGFALLDN